MVDWKDLASEAPHIAEIFVRRHAATGNLCLLATLRSDGFPRISPIEPRIFCDAASIALVAERDRYLIDRYGYMPPR
jgi:hypothetical protein